MKLTYNSSTSLLLYPHCLTSLWKFLTGMSQNNETRFCHYFKSRDNFQKCSWHALIRTKTRRKFLKKRQMKFRTLSFWPICSQMYQQDLHRLLSLRFRKIKNALLKQFLPCQLKNSFKHCWKTNASITSPSAERKQPINSAITITLKKPIQKTLQQRN